MDINLKVPALEKLLDMVASGIGAVGGPMLARWKARSEADAVRIESRGKADALLLIANAQADARKSLDTVPTTLHGDVDIGNEIEARISFQEEKRQSNIASVVEMTASELNGKEVQNHELDHDWAARFFEGVQDVSSEQLQQIWSKILAGEVETPGQTSLNTLAILRNMRKYDAELFSRVAKFTIRDFILNDSSAQNVPGFPTLDELMHLESLNLVRVGFDACKKLRGENAYFVDDLDVLYVISRNKSDKNAIYAADIPCHLLSSSGKELYDITEFPKNTGYRINPSKNADYLHAFAGFLNKHNNGILEYAPIVNRDKSGLQPGGPWIRIKPA